MFSPQPSPIAIDFGSTAVRLLQLGPKEKPGIVAAAELPIPDEARSDATERMTFLEKNLPSVFRSGSFRGRRAVFALPTSQSILQHMQLALVEGVKRDDTVKSQLQITMGIAPDSVVVRSHEVAELNREGQSRTEVICLAIPRELIMRHIALLESCRLEVTGVHAQATAMLHAFDHIHQREGDEDMTTMYIDLGWSGTCVVIGHGCKMAFARAIQVGGQHFDLHIAKALKTDIASARAHRLSLVDPLVRGCETAPRPAGSAASAEGGLARLTATMAAQEQAAPEPSPQPTTTLEERRVGMPPPALAQEVEPGEGHKSAANVDFTELLETITDELSMCLRYHRGLFPGRTINRVVLLGGEARQNWLCRHIAKALRLPARLGDPLARFDRGDDTNKANRIDRSKPQPGWATACGLCAVEA